MFIPNLKIYKEFDIQIREIYKNIPLNCISDQHFDEKPSLTFFMHITDKKQSIKKYSSYQFHMELISINEDIKFLTGLVYFFYPLTIEK